MRKYRRSFSEILVSSNSNMTKSRFMRLFLLSVILNTLVLPVQFYVLYQNSVTPLIPFDWNLFHGSAWWNISLVPTGGTVLFDRWIQIAAGYAVFIFFGLGQEAKTMYRKWLIKFGVGKIFPSLHHSPLPKPNRALTNGSQANSIASRARMLVTKRWSQASNQSL